MSKLADSGGCGSIRFFNVSSRAIRRNGQSVPACNEEVETGRGCAHTHGKHLKSYDHPSTHIYTRRQYGQRSHTRSAARRATTVPLRRERSPTCVYAVVK